MSQSAKSKPEQVEELLAQAFGDRTYVVEPGRVWVSTQNQHAKSVADDMAKLLCNHGIPAGLVYDDGVELVHNGGVQFNYGENA